MEGDIPILILTGILCEGLHPHPDIFCIDLGTFGKVEVILYHILMVVELEAIEAEHLKLIGILQFLRKLQMIWGRLMLVEQCCVYFKDQLRGITRASSYVGEYWIEETKCVHDEMVYPIDRRLKAIVSLLKDDALSWWNSVKMTTPRDQLTYEYFQSTFRSRFVGSRYLKEQKQVFMDLKQEKDELYAGKQVTKTLASSHNKMKYSDRVDLTAAYKSDTNDFRPTSPGHSPSIGHSTPPNGHS
ncbi:hypothetical protein F3Y22_tig00116964pilonHSYRG00066 [Hibiscus syriacus]|uniref:Retrotransposon gag domain-containing protein n=1 Tax=Hibiscus syriacus TaxID=106335 RepID=A0A6A2WK65_HIBSY|nr:hypothetical protein F3Y22_tig00116964pilonHSYRG00066 [Hibiscus syriacus]